MWVHGIISYIWEKLINPLSSQVNTRMGDNVCPELYVASLATAESHNMFCAALQKQLSLLGSACVEQWQI